MQFMDYEPRGAAGRFSKTMPVIKDSSHIPDFVPGTRIILDGVDISYGCYGADVYEDGTGTAFCYKQRDGRPYYDPATDDVAREVRTGKVEILRP